MLHVAVRNALLLGAIRAISCVGPAYAQPNEAEEPPMTLEVSIAGENYSASLGESTKVLIDGKNRELLVKPGNKRELRLKQLRFCYPSYFRFDCSLDPDKDQSGSWDLEGQGVKVSVFRKLASKLRYQDKNRPLCVFLTKGLGKPPEIHTAPSLKVGDLSLDGARYLIPFQFGVIGYEHLVIDVYEVPGRFGNVRCFLLLTGFDGGHPEEERIVRKLLRETFEITDELSDDLDRPRHPA